MSGRLFNWRSQHFYNSFSAHTSFSLLVSSYFQLFPFPISSVSSYWISLLAFFCNIFITTAVWCCGVWGAHSTSRYHHLERHLSESVCCTHAAILFCWRIFFTHWARVSVLLSSVCLILSSRMNWFLMARLLQFKMRFIFIRQQTMTYNRYRRAASSAAGTRFCRNATGAAAVISRVNNSNWQWLRRQKKNEQHQKLWSKNMEISFLWLQDYICTIHSFVGLPECRQ